MSETGDVEVQLKPLHPFFSVPATIPKTAHAVTPPTPDPSCSPASDESRNDPVENNDDPADPHEHKRKRRKTDSSPGASETHPRAPRTKRQTRISVGPSIVTHFGHIDAKDKQVDARQTPGDGRIQESADGSASLLSIETLKPAESNDDAPRAKEPQGAPLLTCGRKSQKLLKLNPATGTIGSPPRSKPLVPMTIPTSGKKRGRKRKALVIAISYGTDTVSRERIGQRINQILLRTSEVIPLPATDMTPKPPPLGQETTNGQISETRRKEIPSQETPTPKKPAHPFFQAKGGKAAPPADDNKTKPKKHNPSANRQSIFTSTPCSPRQARPAQSNSSLPTLALKKGGLKIPGAQYPAWPWRDVVHVRDNLPPIPVSSAESESILLNSRGRKAKGHQIRIAEHENILHTSASKLGIRQLVDDLRLTNDEEFRPIAPLIRIPIKHFESGPRLQARVFKELRTLKGNVSLKTHPAIMHAYNSIATTLSAFDTSTCESIAWAQKYAPTSAGRVLQNGREAELLRDWLQTLKVQAVDTGASDNAPKPKTTSGPRKKRRHKKLEGFIVSSDEESNEMDEISDDESHWLVNGNLGDMKKTVVRSGGTAERGGKLNRLTNAVLLSGPHGCGKSATVYAIAKELDFEVFEINSGSRRSGRDILERVGDMTRNHLVNHQQKEESRADGTTDDEVVKDLKSGKQGMMTSFFKPKSSQQKKEPQKMDQTPGAPVSVLQEKKPNRDQKQSLLLLEEVDVLYEEDKQFWATVISMMAQSKRPFIMTCNNESVVPLQNLKLHGIFRFSPPPLDLAVDMLLLIAANEGHALERCGVEALYESRGYDLRAAITELNYWCQIGVGDLRGGFDWFYPRWPKGSDVDQEGRTIRVVSQNTYHAGMGWINRDLAPTGSSLPSIDLDLYREAWDHWGVDISDHHEVEGPLAWVEKAAEQASSRAARLALMQSVEAFAESMSESDICGPFLAPLSNHVTLDATMPDLHSKTLDDFTIGHKVLEATPLCDYNSISLGVSTSLRLLAQSQLVERQLVPLTVQSSGHLHEKHVIGSIEHHLRKSLRSESPITRKDYSIAFDPIAASEKVLANGYLDPSVFDREMMPLCLDVAPYVRSIVSYDQRLFNERRARSSLLSEGGRPEKKRMRTTRAALSALEGGSRATTRGERYFAADINPYLVMRTGGKSWEEAGRQLNAPMGHTAMIAHESRDVDIHIAPDQS
ncbi:hypothetical protein GGR51DRAFT_243820 [Nemania sp. FL0031]|nr:hypothetical protein GGR51DRAFT_243820 [Nemania sp. FL0031]